MNLQLLYSRHFCCISMPITSLFGWGAVSQIGEIAAGAEEVWIQWHAKLETIFCHHICLLVVIMIYCSHCSPEQEGLVERKLALACFNLIKGRDVQVLHFCFAQVRPARSADSSFCATRRRPGCSLCSWWGPGGLVHFSKNCLNTFFLRQG